MANYNELKARARVIQNETEDGQNTADRVGSLFYDIIAALADVDGGGGSSSTVPNITAAATVDNSTGTPYVNVVRSGADEAPRFTFNFGNLKGATGATGPQGVKGDPGEGIDAETIQHIEDLEKDLEDIMDGLDTEMEEKVKDLFKDAEFLEELFPDGGGGYSNFGQALNDYTDKYLQIIGMWEEDPTTHQKVYKWSKIQQDYNQIQSRVATLETVAGFPDSYEALVADLIQSIKDDEAFAEFMTGYATVQDVNNVKTVVEWLYSGLRNSTTPDRTISEIVSAGKNALGGAIADMRTYVEKLKSGEYVAKASLTAALTDDNNKVLSDAGVLLRSDLNTAKAEIEAGLDGKYATIQNVVTKDSAGNITSKINLGADMVTFDADLIDLIGSTIAVTELKYYNNDNVLVGDVHVSQDGVAISGLAGVSINGTGGVNITGGNLSLSGTNLSFNITNGVDATNFNANYRHVGVSTSDTLGNIVSSLDSRLYTLESSSSSSVDWSDITNAPSIPSFAGYSETDLGNGDLHVTISGGNGGTSNDGVSITASGNGTVFVGGNDTTIDADADLTLSAGSSITADKEITTSSDERLKNIKNLLNPDIAEIAKTRIVSYQYKDNTDNTYLGTIAQDWENIFPDAVKDDKDGYKTFAYQSVALASAVAAAREIVALKAKVAELENKLAN